MSIDNVRQAMIDLQYLRFETLNQIEMMELQGEDTEKERVRAVKYEIMIERLAEYLANLPTSHSLD